MGLDCSTNSIAFCIFWNKRPIKWGKIDLVGNTIYEKILDARKKAAVLSDVYEVDYVAIEGAVMVKSVDVVKKLAYVYGAILSELQDSGAQVIDITPLAWQNHIGNGLLKKDEKEKIKKDFPGHSQTWYTNKGRQMRKQRTMDFFNKRWDMKLTDNDVGDAAGIAYYAYHVLTRRTK